jgi:hypothetical protein
MCEEAVYAYRIIDVATPVTVVARAFASFAPRFSWSVNGVSLPVHGMVQQVTVPVRVTGTVPKLGEPAKDGVPLLLSYLVTDFNDRSQLDITNLAFPGNIDGLEFTAVMTESGSTVLPGLLTGSTSVSPTMRDYRLEARWYEDVSRCNLHWVGVAAVNREALLGKLAELKNTPDPSPEQLQGVVLAARAYAEAAGEVIADAPTAMSTLADVLDRASTALRASDNGVELAGGGQVFRTATTRTDTKQQP